MDTLLKPKKAFTLIELLVVIAIIAVLLSILLPSLKKAKEHVKRISCASRLKGIGTALRVYADANDEKIPPQFVPYKSKPLADSQYVTEEPWQGYLACRNSAFDELMQLAALYKEGYIDTAEVFYCNSQYKMDQSGYQKDYTYSYYTQNGNYEWGTFIPAGDWHIRTSYSYWNYNKLRLADIHVSKAMTIDNIQHWDVVPHRKNFETPLGLNALFADGHVAFCTKPDIFEERLWNPLGNWVWDQGPGNFRAEFDEIVKRLSGN